MDGLVAALHEQLAIDRRHLALGGVARDEQVGAHLREGQVGGEQFEDAHFGRGEGCGARDLRFGSCPHDDHLPRAYASMVSQKRTRR